MPHADAWRHARPPSTGLSEREGSADGKGKRALGGRYRTMFELQASRFADGAAALETVVIGADDEPVEEITL